jgi:group I intron endonuclease
VPYAEDVSGIYKIVNKPASLCYVGQSQRVKKRIAEHFRLLRLGKHPNQRLQNAFNKHGEGSFEWFLEAVCEDLADLDVIENALISGEAVFTEKVFYNIAPFAKAPMRGKSHSEEVRERISKGRQASDFDYGSEEYRKTLSDAQFKRRFSDPEYVKKVKFIIENPEMSYAERARQVGSDTSTVRKIALKYSHLKGGL